MPMFDLPLSELTSYTADLSEPDDFDDFWATTITETRAFDLGVRVEPYPTPWTLLDTYDVSFNGYGGTPVKAWLTVPAGATGPLPTVVQYHGYSGGRSFPHTAHGWASAGYAHLSMDTRGQGWAGGGPVPATIDASADAGGPHSPGFMTAGIGDPATYYYRRVYTDAARMLEAAASLPVVDESKIIICGGSQGGGITLAAGALARLVEVSVIGVAPDVPFLCAFPRALALTDAAPYGEVTRYLAGWRDQVETAYRTLSYFDGALLGQRASAPALFSVALMDQTCPPSTVYAAYNRYGSTGNPSVAKHINVYSHNGHEGGGAYQVLAQAEFFAALLA